MKITSRAVAGTLESNDVLVTVSPGAKGLEVAVDSIVLNQFEAQIRQAVTDTAREMGVQEARIELNDRGALECTIKARVETALRRAGEAAV
ncbi:MAG TPA: citrate lyase acyl carrier protein [Clostridia bacterium]|nr:citrate lyase acyl carrier protein [Clostridia bacterium]